MDKIVIEKYKVLHEQLATQFPEAIRDAEHLAENVVDPSKADPDRIWKRAWDKPLFANTKVATGERACAKIVSWTENRWRDWSDPQKILFEKVGKGSATASFRASSDEARQIREQTGIALHRLFAIQGAAKALAKRAARSSTPYAEFVGDHPRMIVRTVQAEMGPGWGHITVLHFLTDLGLAVKPDLHLVRAVRHLGMVLDLRDRRLPSLEDAILINDRVCDLLKALDGEVQPGRLRYLDKVLMEFSRNNLFRSG